MRVVIVDDSVVIPLRLVRLLSGPAGIEVVGQADMAAGTVGT